VPVVQVLEAPPVEEAMVLIHLSGPGLQTAVEQVEATPLASLAVQRVVLEEQVALKQILLVVLQTKQTLMA
jgi:hypothetical protein